jgi:hypothetical protein
MGSGWRKDARVLRVSAGLVMCLAVAMTVGCGTVPAHRSAHMVVSGCQSSAPADSHEATASTLLITLAGNAKTYCARVGDRLRVDLRGTDSDSWQRPLVSGDALAPIPGAVMTGAVTSASFTAVRPGRVTMTSVRPPCQIAVPSAKNEPEPAFPLPKPYPLKSCTPGHRFSALVLVQR